MFYLFSCAIVIPDNDLQKRPVAEPLDTIKPTAGIKFVISYAASPPSSAISSVLLKSVILLVFPRSPVCPACLAQWLPELTACCGCGTRNHSCECQN
jgi:hypothetical protein